jgi:hypothetical protein
MLESEHLIEYPMCISIQRFIFGIEYTTPPPSLSSSIVKCVLLLGLADYNPFPIEMNGKLLTID